MFNEFWQLYPIKRDKVKAQKAFDKLSRIDKLKAFAGVKREIGYRIETAIAGEWVPAWSYAQGWINGRRWEDELQMPESKPKTNGNAPWEALTSKLGVVPSGEYPSFDDPLISKAMNNAGSWMEFARMTEKQQLYIFKPRFSEAYNALKMEGG